MTSSTERRQGRFTPIVVMMVLLGVLGAVGLWRDTKLDVDVAGVSFTLAAALVWIVYGALFIGVVVVLQRFGHRPGWAVALAVLWGGFVAVDVAGRANTAVISIASNLSDAFEPAWPVWLTGPLIEESVKALGIILIALIPVSRRFGVLDGVFYGAVVGASFQVVEDFEFAVAGVSNSPTDPTQALITTFFLRGVLGVFSHVVYSALVGAAIGWVASGGREGRGPRVAAATVAFFGAVALHGVTNWTAIVGWVVPHLAISVVGFAVLVVVIVRARRSEEARLIGLADDERLDLAEGVRVAATGPADTREQKRARRKALAAVSVAEQRVG